MQYLLSEHIGGTWPRCHPQEKTIPGDPPPFHFQGERGAGYYDSDAHSRGDRMSRGDALMSDPCHSKLKTVLSRGDRNVQGGCIFDTQWNQIWARKREARVVETQ